MHAPGNGRRLSVIHAYRHWRRKGGKTKEDAKRLAAAYSNVLRQKDEHTIVSTHDAFRLEQRERDNKILLGVGVMKSIFTRLERESTDGNILFENRKVQHQILNLMASTLVKNSQFSQNLKNAAEISLLGRQIIVRGFLVDINPRFRRLPREKRKELMREYFEKFYAISAVCMFDELLRLTQEELAPRVLKGMEDEGDAFTFARIVEHFLTKPANRVYLFERFTKLLESPRA
jgi:hypothetical protein